MGLRSPFAQGPKSLSSPVPGAAAATAPLPQVPKLPASTPTPAPTSFDNMNLSPAGNAPAPAPTPTPLPTSFDNMEFPPPFDATEFPDQAPKRTETNWIDEAKAAVDKHAPELVGGFLGGAAAGTLGIPTAGVGGLMAGSALVGAGAVMGRSVWESGKRLIDTLTDHVEGSTPQKQQAAVDVIKNELLSLHGMGQTGMQAANTFVTNFGANAATGAVAQQLEKYALKKFIAQGIDLDVLKAAEKTASDMADTARKVFARVLPGMEEANTVTTRNALQKIREIHAGKYGKQASTELDNMMNDGHRVVSDSVDGIISRWKIGTKPGAFGDQEELTPHTFMEDVEQKLLSELGETKQKVMAPGSARQASSVDTGNLYDQMLARLQKLHLADDKGELIAPDMQTQSGKDLQSFFVALRNKIKTYSSTMGDIRDSNTRSSLQEGNPYAAAVTEGTVQGGPKEMAQMPEIAGFKIARDAKGRTVRVPIFVMGAEDVAPLTHMNLPPSSSAGTPSRMLSFGELDSIVDMAQKMGSAARSRSGDQYSGELSKLSTEMTTGFYKALEADIAPHLPQEAAALARSNARFSGAIDDVRSFGELLKNDPDNALKVFMDPGKPLMTKQAMHLLSQEQGDTVRRMALDKIRSEATKGMPDRLVNAQTFINELDKYHPDQISALFGGDKNAAKELRGLLGIIRGYDRVATAATSDSAVSSAGNQIASGVLRMTIGLTRSGAAGVGSGIMRMVRNAIGANKPLAKLVSSTEYTNRIEQMLANRATPGSATATSRKVAPILGETLRSLTKPKEEKNGR